MLLRSPKLRAAALVAGLSLCAVPAAHADSVVYIQGGNVWTMKGDGSGKVQLTDGGSWHSPTQADDGTIAAVQGTNPIVVMAKDGRVLRTIKTGMAPSADGGTFGPAPVSLSFSPDGTKIAYSYVANSCPIASSCGTIQRSVFYTRADATPDATPVAEWGNQFGVGDPEWITNDRTLVFGGAGVQVDIDTLDAGDYNYKNWFNGSTDIGDGELSRDGKKMAFLFGYGKTLALGIAAVSGDPATSIPPKPVGACETGADEKFNDPSWSPDGTHLAVGTSGGVEVLDLTTVAPNVCSPSGDSVTIAPGGSTPDWGPADPATARYVPQSGDGGKDDGNGGKDDGNSNDNGNGGKDDQQQPGTKPRLKVAAVKLRSALAKGFKVTVTGAPKGRLTIVAKRSGKVVARGTATVSASGKKTVRVTFTKQARKSLAKVRKLKLTLSGAGSRTTVTLRR